MTKEINFLDYKCGTLIYPYTTLAVRSSVSVAVQLLGQEYQATEGDVG